MNGTDQQQGARFTIRRGMDVYDTGYENYIGSVIETITAEMGTNGARPSGQGRDRQLAGHVFGEELGPFPTVRVGNTGPDSQSRVNDYGTHGQEALGSVAGIVVRPGRVNPFARPLYIPLRFIRSIAMDRLILNVEKSGMPREWRSRQAFLKTTGASENGGWR